MYVTEFKVVGRGEFPIDMLRYDACYPATQDDVGLIEGRDVLAEVRTVYLRTRHATKTLINITPDRWRSFGWQVEAGSLQTRKVS